MRKIAVTLFIILFIGVTSVFPYSIPAYSSQTFVRPVSAGAFVNIIIAGDGSTNLDLYVYAGNVLIGKSESYGDRENVQFRSPGNGQIGIVVVNRGNRPNTYQANF